MDTVDVMSAAFSDELQKIARVNSKNLMRAGKATATIGAWEALRRANNDRKMGRAMRRQQGSF